MCLKSQQLGQIGQLKVEIEAAKRGIITSVPTIPARYDLILEKNGKIMRAQVKYCDYKHKRGDRYQLILSRKKDNRQPYKRSEIDILLVYYPAFDKILAFPPKMFHNVINIYVGLKKNSKYYYEKFIW